MGHSSPSSSASGASAASGAMGAASTSSGQQLVITDPNRLVPVQVRKIHGVRKTITILPIKKARSFIQDTWSNIIISSTYLTQITIPAQPGNPTSQPRQLTVQVPAHALQQSGQTAQILQNALTL